MKSCITKDKKIIFNYVVSFSIAFSLAYFILVKAINVPGRLTGAYKLVHEYYVKGGSSTFILDFVLVAVYLGVSRCVALQLLKDDCASKIGCNIKQNIIVAVVSSFISSGFWLYFTSKPKNNARFFSRWFHTAGVWAVVYDAIYLVLVNVLMNMLIRTLIT